MQSNLLVVQNDVVMHRGHNQLTAVGREQLAKFLVGQSPDPPAYIALGDSLIDNDTTHLYLQTALVREWHRGLVPSAARQLISSDVLRLNLDLVGSKAPGQFQQLGLFDAASAPVADVVVSAFDAVGSWVGLTLDNADYTEGSGSLYQAILNYVTYWESIFLNTGLSVNAGSHVAANAFLQLWVKGEIASFNNASYTIFLGSSGANYYSWTGTLAAEASYSVWRVLRLKLSSATVVGAPNLSALSYFRVYFTGTGPGAGQFIHLDDARVMTPLQAGVGNLWAIHELPTLLTKQAKDNIAIVWYLSASELLR